MKDVLQGSTFPKGLRDYLRIPDHSVALHHLHRESHQRETPGDGPLSRGISAAGERGRCWHRTGLPGCDCHPSLQEPTLGCGDGAQGAAQGRRESVQIHSELEVCKVGTTGPRKGRCSEEWKATVAKAHHTTDARELKRRTVETAMRSFSSFEVCEPMRERMDNLA